MAVTNFSPLLGLALPTTGDLDGTWGTTVNDSITQLLDSAVAGTTTLSADADVTLSTTNGAANQARNAVILWTAGGTVTRNITAPAQSKAYFVVNKTSSTQSIVIRGAGPTTGVTVRAGQQALVVWNGVDFVEVASGDVDGPSSATDNAVARFDGTTGKLIQNSVVTIADSTGNMAGVGTLGVGAITTSGALTYGGVTLSNSVTGTGSMVLSTSPTLTSPTLVTPALGTPASGVVTNLTGTASININGTVGATTANTGAFTTLTASTNINSTRINPRTSTVADTATLTPDISTNDQFNITAQAQALSVAAPTGTPVDGNKLILRILDNGTARAITWNATYTAIGTTLPTTTTVNKTTYVGCVYNANNTRWDVVDVNIQGYNAIGDIFFSTSPASENLLLCQGQRISKANYPALSGILPDFFNFAATTQTTRQFRGMAFNGSVFCSVVGGGSASNVAVTSPDGVTWTARTLPSTVTWQDIAWNGSVFFACAGGGSATSLAATSPDGITWTSRTLPSSSTWSRVIWNGTQFLAIATNSTAAATSTDGITWTARTLPSASAWNAIAWNGSEYLIVIQSSSSAITSPDGITWTTRTMPAASGWITLAANNSIFCALRQNTTEAYTSSDNGVTWTRRFLPVSSNWTVLKWVNNAFFALGQGGTTLLRSTDGISWFVYTVNSQTWGGTNNIEFGNSTLVALTANGTGGFAGSFDSADYQAPFAGVSLNLYVVIRAR